MVGQNTIPIEQLVLPGDFKVHVATRNVKLIRMFEEEQVKLSNDYLEWLGKGRVLPSTTAANADKQLTVKVCVSKPRSVKVFLKGSRKLSSTFTKAYRAGRILTPLPDVMKTLAPPSAEKKATGNQVKARQSKVVKDSAFLAAVESRMKANKKLIGLHNKLTKGNNIIHRVTLKFKMFHIDEKGKQIVNWETYRTTFTSPVFRAFQEFATSTVGEEFVYTFFGEDDYNTTVNPYEPLILFLKFIDHANDGLKFESNDHDEPSTKMKNERRRMVYENLKYMTRKRHTPDAEHRLMLTYFVEKVDYLQNIDSKSLMEIRLTSDVPLTNEVTTPGGLADSVVADHSATYVNSEYFEGELLRMDNSLIVRADNDYVAFFESFVGVAYRPNSCLATCALHHIYLSIGTNFGKVKWWKDRSMKTYPPPTYETISSVCGIPFDSGGSLRLSLNQFKPFLDKYSMRCFAITPRATLVFKHIPQNDNMTKPLGLTGLKLIISHNHVNLIPNTLRTKFSNVFMEQSPAIDSEMPKQLVHECYQVPAPKDKDTFTRFPIRRNFEPPKGVSVDRSFTNIEADAQKMVDVLTRMVFAEQETKVKSNRVCSTYHYHGDIVRIIHCLKEKHSIIASPLKLSGHQNQTVKTFSVVYRAHGINATLIVGNMMESQLTNSDADNASLLIQTHEDFEAYNGEFQLFYHRLYNKSNMTTYSETLKHELITHTCPPPAFSIAVGLDEICVGSIDKNKAYASNMVEMNQIPIFSPFAEMESTGRPMYVNTSNAHKLSDFAIYKVQTDRLNAKDVARYIIFDKKTILYYGKYLKEVVNLLPDITFKIIASIEPYKTNSIEWATDLKRMYNNDRLTNAQKKLIPNTLLGSLDKYRHQDFTADCFFSRKEADCMYNEGEGVSRVTIKSDRAESTWDECVAQVERNLIGEIDNEIDKWNMVNECYQKKKPTLHVNVHHKGTSTFSQGFLPISLMKYNHNRIAVLKMWLRVAESGTLIPIAVKTDCVYVAENTFENYCRLSKRLRLRPNAEWEEIIKAEEEKEAENDRIEAEARMAFNTQMSLPLTESEKAKACPWLFSK